MFLAIGTSGNVYPAAGFVQVAGRKAHTVEFNLNRSEVSSKFQDRIIGPASQTVPDWVDRFLENGNIPNV